MAASVHAAGTDDDIVAGQSLNCAICSTRYRNAKILPCNHSFCESCLEKTLANSGGRLICVHCKHVCQEVVGVSELPPSVLMNSLVDAFAGENNESEADTTRRAAVPCPTHTEKCLDIYCQSCLEPLCDVCVLVSHGSHTHTDIKTAADKFRGELSKKLQDLGRHYTVADGSDNSSLKYIPIKSDVGEKRGTIERPSPETVRETRFILENVVRLGDVLLLLSRPEISRNVERIVSLETDIPPDDLLFASSPCFSESPGSRFLFYENDTRVGTAFCGDQVYIADSANGRIKSRGTGGALKPNIHFDRQPTNVMQHFRCRFCPIDLAIFHDNLYVTDQGNHQIVVCGNEGGLVKCFGSQELMKPYGIAIHDNDIVYVTDSDAHCIKLFNTDGEFRSSFGCHGNEDGEFDHPECIRFNKEGRAVVSDGSGRIQEFNVGKDGALSVAEVSNEVDDPGYHSRHSDDEIQF